MKNRVLYERRIFAYVDILGFESLVWDAGRDPNKLGDIYDLLELARSVAHRYLKAKPRILKVDMDKFRFRLFSDTVTISCPSTSRDYLMAMATLVMIYQYLFLDRKGKFLRGAMVCDDICEHEEIVFGPAIIKAYKLEQDRAGWPRVLVDDSVLNGVTADELERYLAEFLCRDTTDGLIQLDYLREFFVDSGDPRWTGGDLSGLCDPMAPFNIHKTRLETEIRSPDDHEPQTPGVLEKYKRLAHYHNSSVDRQSRAISMVLSGQILLEDVITEYVAARQEQREPVYTAENIKYVDILPFIAKPFRSLEFLRKADVGQDQVPASGEADTGQIRALAEGLSAYLRDFRTRLNALRIQVL